MTYWGYDPGSYGKFYVQIPSSIKMCIRDRYMRDKTTLTKIRTKAALEEEVATEEATDDNGVITF